MDKDSYNKIVRDIEANTVRLKELGSDVLVLEKSPRLHKYGYYSITLQQLIDNIYMSIVYFFLSLDTWLSLEPHKKY